MEMLILSLPKERSGFCLYPWKVTSKPSALNRSVVVCGGPLELHLIVHVKKETHGQFRVRWINLEPIIESEVSQKGEDKYCIVRNIYRI